MKKTNLNALWQHFLRWKGWSVCAHLGTIAFGLPFWVMVLLCAVCGAGLVWVFTNGMDLTVPAYGIYALSAYSLTGLCVKLPEGIGMIRRWLFRHRKLTQMLGNPELKFGYGLVLEQIINFGYGIFKIGSGMVYGSAWIGSEGIYNLAQALIQHYQSLRRKKAGTMVAQWRSYRMCGVLILLMHLTLVGIVFQMVNWNRAKEQGQIQVIVTAAFVFYKIITSFLSIARDRKHIHPVESSIRMLSLTQAIFSIFSLQASMIHAFGTGEAWEGILNLLTGCGVCLLVVCTGIYMIRRGNREIRTLQEIKHGA